MKMRVTELPKGKPREVEGREMRQILREFLTKYQERAMIPEPPFTTKMRRHMIEAMRRGEGVYDGVADKRFGNYNNGRHLLMMPDIKVMKGGEEMTIEEAKKRGHIK